ncbi:nicotinamide riboside kinase 1 [Brachionus plicatilis]|uniref:Nicotinamide riboside kinase 1 n=1 Tax=Brachionus plicatilis TaxID=10195 RepID=A0A3M7PF27_BRAPC|nr:nicotinamide riboside kinase 1 [Brachionus plicatilis]
MTKTKLIGISGCTNGGKTTLCKKLLDEFANSVYLSQDEFYLERNGQNYEFIKEVDSYNFDVITAIDMKKFHKKLTKLLHVGKYDYVFIDGILLYDDEKLVNMLDRKYFLDLDKEEAAKRRKNRQYIMRETENYFEVCAWNEFLKYKQKCIQNIKNATYLNGNLSQEEIFNFVLNDLP